MQRLSPARRFGVAALLFSTLAIAACGGGDDGDADSGSASSSEAGAESSDAATADSEPVDSAEPTGPAEPTEAASSTDGGGTIVVNDMSDMPEECVALMAEFLKLIEPVVSEIDWSTATTNEFQNISAGLETQFSELDERTAASGCDNYDFTDDEESLAAVLALAEDEAPGTTGWLEFIGALSTELTGDAGDVPTDCAGAIAYVETLVAEGGTISDIPIAVLTAAGQAVTAISTTCSQDQATEFFGRPEVSAFLSG